MLYGSVLQCDQNNTFRQTDADIHAQTDKSRFVRSCSLKGLFTIFQNITVDFAESVDSYK